VTNSDENRWRQRLQNFEKATSRLVEACKAEDYTDLERAGLVKTFEFSFELAWKTLKDLLFFEGYDERSPREVLRRAFQTGYLTESETEVALDALDKRNLLSHTYDEGVSKEAVSLIKEKYEPMLRSLLARMVDKRDSV